MNYSCKLCDFKTFNESEYMQHVKNHVEPVKTEPGEVLRKKEPNGAPRFLPRFLGKNVVCTAMTGQQYNGTLTGFNEYELFLDIQGQQVLFWKHALLSMKMTGANV